jgi:gliding motility-associated-like protein
VLDMSPLQGWVCIWVQMTGWLFFKLFCFIFLSLSTYYIGFMMKKILVLFLLFYGFPLCAQTFINQYFTPDGSINIRQHIPASGGGYYICGAEQDKGFIAQLDSIGAVIWKKQYDTGVGVFAVDDLVESKDGTLIAIMNTVAQQNENVITAVFKISATTGAVLWTTQWSIDKTTFTFIEPSTDGYILAGASFNNTNLSLSENQRLAKINENGGVVWQRTFETPFTKVRTLYTDALGNAYVTGVTNGSSFLDEIFIFNPNGTLIDNFGYNGGLGNNFSITAVRPLIGGDYLVAGTLLTQGANSLMVVFRIRPTGGAVLWSRSYGMNGFNWEIVDMEQLPDGQFVALCKDRTPNNTAPVALLKFQTNNTLTWMRGIDLPGISEMGTSLSVTADGYIEIVGNAVEDAQNSNGFFIRADSSGSVVGDCPRPNLNVLVQNIPLFTNEFGYFSGPDFGRTVVNINVSASELTRRQEIYVPNIVFFAPDTACVSDCIIIKTNEVLVDLAKSEWVFEGGEPSTFSGVNPPPICYNRAGVYTITFTVGACTAPVTRQIVINGNLGVPNAFTPNQDDVNDGFRPLLECATDAYNFEIYNRWGQRIFFTDQREAAWNGTYLEADAPVDVYFWRLQYSVLVSGVLQSFSTKGEVSLIR